MKIGSLANKYSFLAIVAVIAVALDQWTKWMIHSRYRVGETTPLLGSYFSLTYVRNQGAAFGILQTANPAFREPFFLLVPIVAIVVLGFLYYKQEPAQKLSLFALALVLSGAIGNLIDRFRLGYVIDFLDVHWKEAYHWPAFNVADSCVVVGVGLLLLLSRSPGNAR